LSDIGVYVAIGFLAQLIDGALGMAYGIVSTSLLLSIGITPAVASATVHTAECFTTGASALSHHSFGNIDRTLFRKLVLPGMLGAAIGASVLSIFPAAVFTPIIATYLAIMGVVIVIKAFGEFPPRIVTRHVAPLGLFGGFFDAAGGGGWGPIVATTLVARGSAVRQAIGSTNAVEFFVAFSATTVFTIGLAGLDWRIIAGLAIGGAAGAPLGAWLCRRLPIKPFMAIVGILVIVLGVRTLLGAS